jgi:hypothetical protein
MSASRARNIVLFLDCCYGGAFAQGVKVRAAGDVNVLDSFPQEKAGGGRGRAVITASGAMQYAFEGEQLADDRGRRPSVFTSALVEGLATGDADRDEDGWVSLNELYDYVFDKVREQNPHQTPSRQVDLSGELYLARSRRRRIRPAPLPPDLQAAMTDSNMYTRLGAVSELQSRLTSDDLPVAAGAYEALAELARRDIGYVADPASAALSQAALRAEETGLHFGQIEQGSPPPHRTLRLLGPPIARACAPRASHEWIRVDETAEGFDISVDTANAGTLRGTLDLKGPTGETVIAIDVELIPPMPQAPGPPQDESTDRQLAAAGGAGQPEQRRAAQGHQAGLAAGGSHAKPVVPPKLELSATVVDFGQLPLCSEPPERRVRLGNAGGGSLNARVATQADWLKLRQDGDELVVTSATSEAGEHQSTVTVDSDGGSATIRVQARIIAPDLAPEADVNALPGAAADIVPAEPGYEPAAVTRPTARAPGGGAGDSSTRTAYPPSARDTGRSPDEPASAWPGPVPDPALSAASAQAAGALKGAAKAPPTSPGQVAGKPGTLRPIPDFPDWHPEISGRYRNWLLAAYIIPVAGVGEVGIPLLLLLMIFRRPDRLFRMNAVQSLEICLFGVATIAFGVTANLARTTPPKVSWAIAAGICGLAWICLFIFCIAEVARKRQPRIKVLSRMAYRLAYGRSSSR